MRNSPSWGPKARFLLLCLHAGWSPVTKSTHDQAGELRCNYMLQRLVLFKREFFLVFERNTAILRTAGGVLSEISYHSYEKLPRHSFKVVIRIRKTTKKVCIDLERPELGQIPVSLYKKDIFFKFWRVLLKFLSQNGRAPTTMEFRAAVIGIVNRELIAEIIKGGIGKFWTKEKHNSPPSKTYWTYYPSPAHIVKKHEK
jgi:hypothetical protein